MDDCAEFCKAMSEETRQKILRMLMDGEKNVSEIVKSFDMSQPTISHHLNILKQLGLVTRRKEGKQVYYAIDRERVIECCGMLVAKFDNKEENMKK
jgi:ArsR family transcriptional regulator